MNAACTGKRQTPRDAVPGPFVVSGALSRHGEKAANSRKDSRSDIQRNYQLAIPSELKEALIVRVWPCAPRVATDRCQHSCDEAEKDENDK
jgi:hypothetical protein